MKLNIIIETNEGEILISKTVQIDEDGNHPEYSFFTDAIDEAQKIREKNLVDEANRLINNDKAQS